MVFFYCTKYSIRLTSKVNIPPRGLTTILIPFIILKNFKNNLFTYIMQNNTTKIVAAIIAILAIGGIATFALSGNKPADKMVKDAMSKTSEVMKKTEEATKMTTDKMAMEKEAMMKKDAMSKSSDAMKKDGETMMKADGTKMTADEMAMMKKDEAMKIEKDKMMKEGDAMSKDAMLKKGEESSPQGTYTQYSVNALAQNTNGTNIIFFHAPWCPTCKAGETDINANLDKIPANFQILKTDFDTSTALKQKYGVTSQSTFVKVDKDGNKISMGNGFTKLADIVAFGQK
jgi:thiol-disulfide isomerase/thioredoxin